MRPWYTLVLCLAVIIASTAVDASTIPTSARAREVIDRIKPSLEKRLKAKGLQWGAPIFLRIFKRQKRLEVYLHDGRRFRLFDTFKICTYGLMGLGPKMQAGDGRAPEGFYFVTPRQLNPYSKYHLAFNLGYPNAYDRLHSRTGSALMVHGSCVSIGCYAMTDKGIEMIYALADAALRNGQPFFRVHIFPFPMTDRAMARHQTNATKDLSRWTGYWGNLKKGYDYFERHGRPPNVNVENGRYVFSDDS